MSGRKHYDKTKKILSDANTGEKNPMFGKTGENNPNYGKTLSNETKIIMSDVKKGENNPMFGKLRPSGAGRPSQQIEVTDITNNTTISYDSISEAAGALNLSSYKIISMYIQRNQKKPYKGQYTFKKL